MAIPDRFLYHPSSSPVLFFYGWDTLLGRLSYFSHNGPDFAIIEVEDGSYIQCAGTKKRLAVETRHYDSDLGFRHEVWGKGDLTDTREMIPCTDGDIQVDASQILAMRDGRLLIRAFLEGGEMPARYTATDVSDRFDPVLPATPARNKAWDWPDRRRHRKQQAEQGGAGQPATRSESK